VERIDAFFGAATIAGKTCSADGCEGYPVAAMPRGIPDEGGFVWAPEKGFIWAAERGVHWLCAEHVEAARAVIRSYGGDEGFVKEIDRTCHLSESGESSCGDFATVVIVIETRGEGLGLLSVCGRHAPPPSYFRQDEA
jgi:hypothetical protein